MVARCIFWMLCLGVCFGLIPAHAAVVDVAQAANLSVRLSDHAKVYEDISGNMDARQAAALAEGPDGFIAVDQLRNPGKRSPSPWWIKVQLRNTGDSNRSFSLILNPGSVFYSADFYIVDHDQTGAAGPVRKLGPIDQPAAQRLHSATLTLAPRQSQTVLIRTTGVAPVQLAPYLYSNSLFGDYLERSGVWDGLLFGGLLALAWTAWTLALFTRSTVFLLLGLLSFVTLLVEALRRGYGKPYLPADALEWGYRSPLVLGNLALLLFVVFILEVARAEKMRLPLHTLLIGWAIYKVGLILLSIFGNIYDAYWLTEHLRPFFSLTLLAIAILFVKHNAPTRKLMLAVALFSIARASLAALETYGMLPDYIADLSMGTIRMNPAVALAGFFVNLTLLAAWVAHVGSQRTKAQEDLARLQREENRRLAEEVARQTEALTKAVNYADEKNRQQTKIVGYISHDLRAPLVTIAGYTKLMEQSASDQQKPLLNTIARSADYQLNLIDDILGYAAAELKPLYLKPERTDLANFLDDIAQHAMALSRQHNNRFSIAVYKPIPRTIWLDGRRLRQVLLNLLSNATKFTRGGVIRLDLLATHSEDGWNLRFAVSDSGIGIDAAKQAEIFKAFSQLDPDAEGVGLGLHIAQSILKTMGSELKVDSAVGSGSTIAFEINVATADSQVVTWLAPATFPSQAVCASRSVDTSLEAINRKINAVAGSERHTTTAPMPPEQIRNELALMAKGGHLTDMERWLHAMTARYPACADYFDKIHEAMDRLDLDAVARLARCDAEGSGNSKAAEQQAV